jgi:hypothetical protein
MLYDIVKETKFDAGLVKPVGNTFFIHFYNHIFFMFLGI